MLTYEDCLAMCDFNEAEIMAIAEHEHIPPIVAIELAQYLVETEDGKRMLKRMILDDIQAAREHGNDEKVAVLNGVLMHFIATHPEFPSQRRQDQQEP